MADAIQKHIAEKNNKKNNDALSLGTLALFVVGDDLNGICHEKVLIFD